MVIQVSNGRETCFGENAHDRLVATGDCRLANAASGTRSQQRQLSKVAVRAHREGLAPPTRECLAGVTEKLRRFVKADERMRSQISNAGGCAMSGQISLMRE
jgi:hypothetical protein